MNRRSVYKLIAFFMFGCVVFVPRSRVYKRWKVDIEHREYDGSRVYSLISLRFRPKSYLTNTSEKDRLCPESLYTELKPNLVQKTHVAFIKTHKCASSTIQNIFLRYGLRNKLTFLLPKNGGNHIGWPEPFDARTHMRKTTRPPDLLCYHSVYSQSMTDVMPEDTVYVTTLRDPFEQIKSLYVYSRWALCTKLSLSELLQERPTRKLACDSPFYNPMIFDLGYPMEAMLDYNRVDQYIDMLDKRFNLVMIVEYLDESLIILRDMLGWATTDVLAFPKNRQKFVDGNNIDAASSIRLSLGIDLQDTPKDRAKVYEVMQADTRLYNHFKRKLECIIEANREYIQREVKELRRIRQWWSEFCIDKHSPLHSAKYEKFGSFGNVAGSYVLTEQGKVNQSCIDMALSELALVAMIDEQQP